MALNEHQMRQVVEWFRSRVKHIVCSVCGNSDFRFDAELAAVPVFPTNVRAGEAPPDRVPTVVLICTHCASLRYFSAAMIGIAPSETGLANTPRLPLQGH